jgi:hypothetical protein
MLRLAAVRLPLALGFGLAVAAAYRRTRRKALADSSAIPSTLVLLTILVAMTTIVIEDSLARAFGLVGALAIVRFRTVVEDTRDTAFVIFAVVTGMAVGAGHFVVCLVGVPLTAATAILLESRAAAAAPEPPRPAGAGGEHRLLVRLGAGRDPETVLADALRERAESRRFLGAATARQGAAIDVRYALRLRPSAGPVDLLEALHRVEGVQHVEIDGPA